MAGTLGEYLKQLLAIHWLRPETALWRVFDCMLMHDVSVAGRAVDLGCGDGTMSYIMAGGRIRNYDVFLDVGHLSEYTAGADIHDVLADRSLDTDDSQLRYNYSFGIDHKEGLVSKVRRFKQFYRQSLVHDLNEPLPFQEEAFDTMFSNILYWLQDVDTVLADWNRVLTTNGKLILFVPNINFMEKAWLYYQAPHQGNLRYLNFLDRGYGSLIHHCYSASRWEEYFEKNGFQVAYHKPYLTDIVMKIWNIGTRPIAGPLIQMANRLLPLDRQQSKGEWVDYFTEFFCPILEEEFAKPCSEHECAFHFYVLEKKT